MSVGNLPLAQPVEGTAVDQHTADGDAVSAEELRRRVVDEVGTVVEWRHQPRRGKGRIHQQRHSVLVCDAAHRRDIEYIESGIAERLAEQQARARTDRSAPALDVARVDEGRLDAKARQRKGEQVVGAAVERATCDDVAARTHQRGNGEVQGGLSARGRNRAHALFERGHALLQHGHCRIGDA